MSRVDHQCHHQRLQRREGAQQHADGHELHGAREDGQAHDHGIEEAESRHVHVDAVGQSQKPEARKDGDGVGKGCDQCFL